MSDTNFTTPTTINSLSEVDITRIHLEQTLIATCPGCRVRIASDSRSDADPLWAEMFIEDLTERGWIIDGRELYCSQACIEPGRERIAAANLRVQQYMKAATEVAA